MSVLTKARTDWKKLSQQAFDLDLYFSAPTGEKAVVKGIGADTNIQFNDLGGGEGIGVNDNDGHCSFVESNLVDANPNYPIRDEKGEVSLRDHTVIFMNSNGEFKGYHIKENHPDNTVGVIFCKLSNFDPGDPVDVSGIP